MSSHVGGTPSQPAAPAVARAACFLDRDGTLMVDTHYPADPARVRLIPGAADAVARLNTRGIPAVVVTNQSGIARGLISDTQYAAVRDRLNALLDTAGAKITATYHCPHLPNAEPPCDCRKPALGMYQRAAADHGLDISRSAYIGDRWSDVEPAVRVGGVGMLVPGADTRDDHIALAREYAQVMPTLADAISHFLAQLDAQP